MGCRGIWIAIHETEDGMCHASDAHNAVRVTMPATATSWDEATVTLTQGQPGVTWHFFGWRGLEMATTPPPVKGTASVQIIRHGVDPVTILPGGKKGGDNEGNN
jgi:hypothetical protein